MLSQTQLVYYGRNTVPRSLPMTNQSSQHFQKKNPTQPTNLQHLGAFKFLVRYMVTATLGRPKPDINNPENEGFYLLDSNATLTLYVYTYNVYNPVCILPVR